MGWHFKWVSSFGSDFNFDYQVSSTPEEKATGVMIYNYAETNSPATSAPGASVFSKIPPARCSTPIRVTDAASTF